MEYCTSNPRKILPKGKGKKSWDLLDGYFKAHHQHTIVRGKVNNAVNNYGAKGHIAASNI